MRGERVERQAEGKGRRDAPSPRTPLCVDSAEMNGKEALDLERQGSREDRKAVRVPLVDGISAVNHSSIPLFNDGPLREARRGSARGAASPNVLCGLSFASVALLRCAIRSTRRAEARLGRVRLARLATGADHGAAQDTCPYGCSQRAGERKRTHLSKGRCVLCC